MPLTYRDRTYSADTCTNYLIRKMAYVDYDSEKVVGKHPEELNLAQLRKFSSLVKILEGSRRHIGILDEKDLKSEGNLSKPIKTFIIDDYDILTIVCESKPRLQEKQPRIPIWKKDVSLPIIPFAILLFSFIPLGAALASRGLWIPYPTY